MDLRKLRHFMVVGFSMLALLLVLACGEQEDSSESRLGDRSREHDETAQQQIEGEQADSSSGETAQQQVWSDPAGLEYVYIPPGSFQMGCVPGDEECYEDESPRHQVTITRGFYMCRTEVTVRAYRQFCDATGRSMPPEPENPFADINLNPGWRNLDHPIVMVTWHDAVAYCEWAGVRLPTEAEWEYAARGGQEGWKYVWGNQDLPIVNGINQANVRDEACRRAYPDWDFSGGCIFSGYDDGYGSTAPVESFPANGYGLYDMAGNVWGWCSDWYNNGYYGTPVSRRDPQGPSSGEHRVLRSGSWYCYPWLPRVSNRGWNSPDFRYFDFGFRCVRDLESLNP